MRKNFFVFFSFFYFISFSVGVNSEYILNKIENKFEKIKNFKAKITEIFEYKLILKKEVLSGTLIYKKPNKLKITYTLPNEQLLLIDGKFFWLYIKENNQLFKYSLTYKDKILLAGRFIANIEEFKTLYHISLVSEDKNFFYLNFNLKKQEKNYPNQIEITTDKKTWLITKCVYIDSYNNQITILFEDITLNIKIPQNFFEFEIPEGTNITFQEE